MRYIRLRVCACMLLLKKQIFHPIVQILIYLWCVYTHRRTLYQIKIRLTCQPNFQKYTTIRDFLFPRTAIESKIYSFNFTDVKTVSSIILFLYKKYTQIEWIKYFHILCRMK